jgi:hypothetical protein
MKREEIESLELALRSIKNKLGKVIDPTAFTMCVFLEGLILLSGDIKED